MPLLIAQQITKDYPISTNNLLSRHSPEAVRAVDNVSLDIEQGETLGLVGESGCGKSTLGRCLLRLVEPDSGTITFDNQNLLSLSPGKLRKLRTQMQIVFQDPFASLNPRMTVAETIAEPLAAHNIVAMKEIGAEVARLLEQVGLTQTAAGRYPHEFSGGQRQRIGIARALSVRPRFLVADEPVSALDVSIRAQILNLLRKIQEENNLALLFIAHDLGAVRQISHRVAVMYLGQIVEISDSETLYHNPRHPYTRTLLNAIPDIRRTLAKYSEPTENIVAVTQSQKGGCRFRNRCSFAQAICAEKQPPLVPFDLAAPQHKSACHFAADLPDFPIK